VIKFIGTLLMVRGHQHLVVIFSGEEKQTHMCHCFQVCASQQS